MNETPAGFQPGGCFVVELQHMNRLLAEGRCRGGQSLQILQGDITMEKADAIVNAANAHLLHGGGVAGAIAGRGGRVIQRESDEWVRAHGPVTHAQPAWTSAGALPAKYVIHAVGPVWGEGDEDAKLAAAVSGSLRTAAELGCNSLAMPAISTGIFGFPVERAAGIIFKSIEDFCNADKSTLKLIKLVLYDSGSTATFLDAWKKSQEPS
jgi:O-acetyl-ADP-ribose deacetylase (regulator of RNase III)